MTQDLKRDEVIDLLTKLGSERDEDVLEAARLVHARIAAAGATWEDLLVPGDSAEEPEDAEPADGEEPEDETAEPADEVEEPEDETTESPADKAAGNAESLKLIDDLLARSDISPDLREELEGYKSDIAEGEFEDADGRYLRAMSTRLSKRR